MDEKTNEQPAGMAVDPKAVIDNLSKQIGQQAIEIAMLNAALAARSGAQTESG